MTPSVALEENVFKARQCAWLDIRCLADLCRLRPRSASLKARRLHRSNMFVKTYCMCLTDYNLLVGHEGAFVTGERQMLHRDQRRDIRYCKNCKEGTCRVNKTASSALPH